ncbi:MAG: SAM-dependent methyltransferase, partial [Bacteroidaceae bacterium]|nr:SAM-dependent methyltransferase [Bacteroidaceae bacterium]
METALYLIPVTLGETPVSQVLPAYNHDVILGIRHFVVENVRSARRFLRLVDHEFPIDDSIFYEMGKHAQTDQFASYLKPLQQGFPVGVISEAG